MASCAGVRVLVLLCTSMHCTTPTPQPVATQWAATLVPLILHNRDKHVSANDSANMYVYYYRTYEKAVSGGGRGGKRRTCAKGPYQPRPVRSSLATSH